LLGDVDSHVESPWFGPNAGITGSITGEDDNSGPIGMLVVINMAERVGFYAALIPKGSSISHLNFTRVIGKK
jgi:hypothetical protein